MPQTNLDYILTVIISICCSSVVLQSGVILLLRQTVYMGSLCIISYNSTNLKLSPYKNLVLKKAGTDTLLYPHRDYRRLSSDSGTIIVCHSLLN